MAHDTRGREAANTRSKVQILFSPLNSDVIAINPGMSYTKPIPGFLTHINIQL